MCVDVRLHAAVDEFASIAEPLFRADPVTYTVELAVLHHREHLSDDVVMLTVWDEGQLAGAAIQTPPRPLLTNGLRAGPVNAAAADALCRAVPALCGVRGLRATTLDFAEAWRAATGAATVVELDERLHRLGRLVPPTGVAGGVRLSTPEDDEVLAVWLDVFHAEAFGAASDLDLRRTYLRNAREGGYPVAVWEVGGRPVSMALISGPFGGTARIGPVFTPVAERSCGYGSAVTAAATRFALDDGAGEVVLFTDLSNPVSNAIYARIGYEPVSDLVRIGFSAPR